jgi:hypothetical protein
MKKPIKKVHKVELSQEERKHTAVMLRFSLLRMYTLLKAAHEDYAYICSYWGMLAKSFRSPIDDSFSKIDYLLYMFEKEFKKSGHVEQEHIDNQTESSFDIMEFIENQVLPNVQNYLNEGMGIEYVEDIKKEIK